MSDFNFIPSELKSRNQWCLARENKSPCDHKLRQASPINGPWLDFQTATRYAKIHGLKIGFIITEEDGYTCIDLDITDSESRDKNGYPIPRHKWTTPETLRYFSGMLQLCDSYSELSISGKGLHIWIKANLALGRQKAGIGVYPNARFIICTGVPVSKVEFYRLNGVVIPFIKESVIKPIAERQQILDNLILDFPSEQKQQIDLEEINQTLSDDEIWERAREADNSEKFINLCNGDWQAYNFPSQSEADLALMSMFTFYSKSNKQCRRMFRATLLGQRNKATINNVYLDRTLRIIKTRESGEAIEDESAKVISANFLRNLDTVKMEKENLISKENSVVEGLVNRMQQEVIEEKAPLGPGLLPIASGLDWPPGLAGAIAGFIYKSAPRPVKEVAITATLGLLAGILGKAYLVGGTGLNLYIILIARSGIGKEAMHSGISYILNSGDDLGGCAKLYVDFDDMVSGPALVKACEKKRSFVNVTGEWGRKLRRLSVDENGDGPMQQLRTVMTNLYQKSGPASIVGGLKYSDKDKNIESLNGIAYSMIGETTPGTFYQSITATMIEDGFLSRFTTIEYTGERPPANKNPITDLPRPIGKAINNIVKSAAVLNQYNRNISVQCDDEAKQILDRFDLTCDANINGETDESQRQMWNRAHLKVWRICGLLAAADNHIAPVITKTHIDWALNLVVIDINRLRTKILGGEIGLDDSSRYKKILEISLDYLKNKNPPKSYNVNSKMVDAGIITRGYLQKKTYQINSFKVHRNGSAAALNDAIKYAIENGNLKEIKSHELIKLYGFHGRAFLALDLPNV